MTITDHLSTTPRTKRELAERSGYSQRDVELLINAARQEGVPIVSSADGYWLGTPAEVKACADRLRRRAGNQLVTARAMRRTASRMSSPVQEGLGAVSDFPAWTGYHCISYWREHYYVVVCDQKAVTVIEQPDGTRKGYCEAHRPKAEVIEIVRQAVPVVVEKVA